MWTPTCFGDPGKVSDTRVLLRDGRQRRRAHQLRRSQPRASRCSWTAGPTTARRRRDRPDQGRPHLLPRHDRLPGPGQRLRGPRRRARAVVRRPVGVNLTEPADGTSVGRSHHRRRLRPGGEGHRWPSSCARLRRSATSSRSWPRTRRDRVRGRDSAQVNIFTRRLRDGAPSDRWTVSHDGDVPRTSPRATGRWTSDLPDARRARPCSAPIPTSAPARPAATSPGCSTLTARRSRSRRGHESAAHVRPLGRDRGRIRRRQPQDQRQRRTLELVPPADFIYNAVQHDALATAGRAATPTRMAGQPAFSGTDGGRSTAPGAGRTSTSRGYATARRHDPAPLRHRARRLHRARSAGTSTT